MFENEFNISLLIIRHLRGELSEQEQADLNAWLEVSATNRTYFDELVNEETIPAKLVMFNKLDKAAIWNKALKGINEAEPHPKVYQLSRYVSVAAVLLLLSAVAILWFNKSPEAPSFVPPVVHSGKVAPGGNKAYLTLADGKTISLTDANNGQLAEQAGISIQKTGDGQLVYRMAKRNEEAVGKINTVTTPKGGQYQIVLPDGSKVWLNAASTLSFPTSFASMKNRFVELKGEAYFEVAKDRTKPFIVKSNEQKVEVLGTHFNINAYVDEENTKTTLLEGSVRVSGSGIFGDNALLKPNQQSVLTGNTIKVLPVDPESAIDWKNGYFSFNKEDLPTIMRKISRWYDVEIVYQGNYTGNDFTGVVSRNKDVSEVLNLLELTGLVHFKTEGRRIVVMP